MVAFYCLSSSPSRGTYHLCLVTPLSLQSPGGTCRDLPSCGFPSCVGGLAPLLPSWRPFPAADEGVAASDKAPMAELRVACA